MTEHHARTRTQRLRRRNIRAAAIAVLLIGLCFYAAFVKQLPFSSSFLVRGVFASANELKAGNPVRIAGLPVGTVVSVSSGRGDTTVVTMALQSHTGVHTDATLSIEPRLLFEGNFYVALDPGSPGAPALRAGATIPVAQTSTPVQLDQLLDVLDSPTRSSLTSMFAAVADGLGPGSGAGSPAGSRKSSASGGSSGSGAPGFAALRVAARELSRALPPVAQIAVALQGVRPGDLGAAIGSSSDVTSQLAQDPASLADLVSSSDTVLAALASGRDALARDILGLDRLTHVAPGALRALDAALPVVTSFAQRLSPALAVAPPALVGTRRLFEQLRALGGASELPALVRGLGPLVGVAPTLLARLRVMFPRLTGVNTCVARTIVPALDAVLKDGANTTGYPAWKDLLHLGAALSGASASFDGNGVALRIGVAEGDQSGSGLIPGFGQLTGGYQGEGVRPQWLGYGVVPTYRPDQPCSRQAVPVVNR